LILYEEEATTVRTQCAEFQMITTKDTDAGMVCSATTKTTRTEMDL